MALEFKDVLALAKTVAKANSSAPTAYSFGDKKYSYNELQETLRDEFKEIAGTYSLYRENKNTVFALLEQTIDDVLPARVLEQYGQFAEIKTVPLGSKAQFIVKRGKTRAKRFITQVGPAGLYESFRMDEGTFDLGGYTVGGAARIDFERLVRGDENFSEYMDIVLDGLVFAVYGIVQKALRGAIANMPTGSNTNTVTSTWDPDSMAKIISTMKAYGDGAVIFAPPEFIAAMGPDAIGAAGNFPTYSTKDIDDIHDTGRIHTFRGTPIIELPQSFLDETNTTTQIDPQIAYVFPTGGEKVVKIVFEGPTQIDDYKCKDSSLEMNVYKRIGAAILTYHNWGAYKNTSIPQTYTDDSLI
jgi:hypothetical protein